MAPAGTPGDVVRKVNAAANAYLASDKGRAFLKQNTMQAAGGTPADLKAFIDAKPARWDRW